MPIKKTIAISACLLGHKVRYDGEHQANEIIIQQLAGHFNIIPVCPEVEIGLGVPREKIELHQQQDGNVRLLTCRQPVIDLSRQMLAYAHDFLKKQAISGIILKDKSPSCGVANCKQYERSGKLRRDGTGIFAARIMQLNPELPMLQSNVVVQPCDLDSFMQQVYAY